MHEPITCFLPCRKGSERVPRKNIAPFAHFSHGLIEIKLKQLIETPEIDRVVLSTNDEEIQEFAYSLNHQKITIHQRDNTLCSSNTSTDDLVAHAYSLVAHGHILWTHVTSPFVTSEYYSRIITKYRDVLRNGYDSLMTTTPLQGFLWNEHGPINYDRTVEKWPRTQTLDKIHEINSAAFLAHRDIYSQLNDRIGGRPYLFEIDKLIAQDIDWPEDFLSAELFAKSNLVKT